MSVIVSLAEVVSEMVEISDRHTAFLNRRTGEVVSLTEQQRDVLDNGDAASERERELKGLVEAGDLLELPTKFENHEYSIVERFCQSVGDPDRKDELLQAIRGRRAFREFHNLVRRLDLEPAWSGFRERAFREIAVHWLQEHGIAYN